ncbi:MAG: serine--tRNA ligase [Dehalococcoidia bacterium]|nr:serine--tRNA ligase [Dehalococcoidia bacterium]
MISIELIRRDSDSVREAMRKRDYDAGAIDRILELDTDRRSSIVQIDELRARRNEVSQQIGRSKERPPELIEEMREVGRRISELEGNQRTIDEELDTLLMAVPNIPDDSSPVGQDDSANIEVRRVGELPSFEFEPQAHWDIVENLGIADFERGARLAGSRFFVLKGLGAKLQRAVISFMLDLHVDQHGYTEVYLPYMMNSATALASGHLPGFREEMYRDEEDDLWLLPTAEAAITSLHRGEILPADDLPLYYVAHTPCWRRERTSAGRDTRGMTRVHQFDKVEMYKFVAPENSSAELESLVAAAEDVAKALEIPYRILELSTGDLASPAVKAFDVEMWAPGADRWLEVSSCSNCTDYQARRGRVRYRPETGARPRLVHTLNGSGLALPRVMISILENYQQEDGSVVIPDALRPHTGFDRIATPL